MKKFRFLIFMLILTSIFIGCAYPTDDSVIEAESTDEELFEAARITNAFFREKFTIHKRTFTVSNYYIEDVNEQYKIYISPRDTPNLVSINLVLNDTTLTYEKVIISNIRQIYKELPAE